MAKTYLITAATGIGAETVRELVRSGVSDGGINIFFSSLTSEPCAAFAEELHSLGAGVDNSVGDLTDPGFAPAMVAACVSRFGRIDGLFNVAGISGRQYGDGPVHACTEDGWRITLDTNLTTQYRVSREVVGVMRTQPLINGQRGVVLNMSSILALHPETRHFDTVAYAVSKGGILALSRHMAAAYVYDKIRVNAVAPALVRTKMSANASRNETILDFIRNKQPLVGDVLAIEDVARTCAFLLSDASHAITGQCVEIDAGWSLSQ